MRLGGHEHNSKTKSSEGYAMDGHMMLNLRNLGYEHEEQKGHMPNLKATQSIIPNFVYFVHCPKFSIHFL